MQIRPATAADFPAILHLNQESVHFLSPLDAARLAQLHVQAACHRVLLSEGQVAGFLLAFAAGAAYDSVNYQWFAARYQDFLYIDRVVIAAHLQGQGLGRLLYQDLFVFAQAQAYSRVTCEFDVEPPNPASARFHQSFGFREVGSQLVAGGNKRVSLQAANLLDARLGDHPHEAG